MNIIVIVVSTHGKCPYDKARWRLWRTRERTWVRPVNNCSVLSSSSHSSWGAYPRTWRFGKMTKFPYIGRVKKAPSCTFETLQLFSLSEDLDWSKICRLGFFWKFTFVSAVWKRNCEIVRVKKVPLCSAHSTRDPSSASRRSVCLGPACRPDTVGLGRHTQTETKCDTLKFFGMGCM